MPLFQQANKFRVKDFLICRYLKNSVYYKLIAADGLDEITRNKINVPQSELPIKNDVDFIDVVDQFDMKS